VKRRTLVSIVFSIIFTIFFGTLFANDMDFKTELKAAENGDVDAQFRVYIMLESGYGVKKMCRNHYAGYEWLLKTETLLLNFILA